VIHTLPFLFFSIAYGREGEALGGGGRAGAEGGGISTKKIRRKDYTLQREREKERQRGK
jgi:hypothetical protein